MPLLALPFPAIDPILIQIGPFAVRWYALAYIVGIFLGWWYAKRLVANPRLWGPEGAPMKPADIDDFVVWAAVGIILGGRIGYVLFYDLPVFMANPIEIVAVWHGGMSFHGGLLGTILAMILFARTRGVPMWSLFDVIAPSVTFGLFFGRLANFVNGELWGRPTDVPWAMVFPNAGPEPRHPSQLYEAALEGLVLFLVLRLLTHRYHKLATPGFVGSRLHRRLWRGAHLRRVLPPAGHPDRLPRRRPHHGHAALGADDRHRRRLHGLGIAPPGAQRGREGVTALAEKLIAQIRDSGPMTVADFMAACLADPQHGYYMRREPFGRAGDFITAPEISQIFGELVGLWTIGVWEMMGSPDPFVLAELGPGRGTLMADMLRTAHVKPTFLHAASVHLVEMSPRLREVQQPNPRRVRPRRAVARPHRRHPARADDLHRQRVLRRHAGAPVPVAGRHLVRARCRPERRQRVHLRPGAG